MERRLNRMLKIIWKKRLHSVLRLMTVCLFGCLFLAVFGLCGCGKKERLSNPEAGLFRIYYLNQTRTRLTSVEYETEAGDSERIVAELTEQILAVPENPDYQAVLEEGVVFLGVTREENILNLNFNKEYGSMKPTREVICRAALAKTFTQVPGIDYIRISCEGQPFIDSNGNPTGVYAGSDFVDSISDVNSFERVNLTLYYANETRDGLKAETREVVHNMSTSQERLIVEQLLAGSRTGGYPVLPRDTKILNVSTADSVCYVNLGGSFLTGELEAAEYIPIYALVNSLTELQTVNKVQITVDGSADVLYRNSISLVAPLEREEKYIVK